MARIQFWGLPLLALALVIAIIQRGWSESPNGPPASTPTTVGPATVGPARSLPAPSKQDEENGLTRHIYALSDLGDDPNLGNWIAETIPEVVQPGSWNQEGASGGKPVLSYYAPAKILVVYHAPSVQAKVDGFLKDLKKALPSGKDKANATPEKSSANQVLVPAQYAAPNLIKTSDPVTLNKSPYPVPTSSQQPKHLFHFIIRYEGDGIIDTTVADLLKAVYGQNPTKPEPCAPCCPTPATTAAVPCCPTPCYAPPQGNLPAAPAPSGWQRNY